MEHVDSSHLLHGAQERYGIPLMNKILFVKHAYNSAYADIIAYSHFGLLRLSYSLVLFSSLVFCCP